MKVDWPKLKYARNLNNAQVGLFKQVPGQVFTHVQYTQTDTNREETFTNGTIGKKQPFVKEALQFARLVRMES